MESKVPSSKELKSESRLKSWFTRLFCIGEPRTLSIQQYNKSQRLSKSKTKQKIHMSLLGSFKNSSLCKVSRKNFVVQSNQVENDKLPGAISKYIGGKINSSTVIVMGEISNKVTKKIPYVLKILTANDKPTGECIFADIATLKVRVDDLCIFRPNLSNKRVPQLLQMDQSVSREISLVVSKFRNSIIILPKDTILDEIGLILSSTNKFVEVETIVANGTTLCIVVYVGTKQFVLISQNQQIQFVVKQLKKDLMNDDPNISQLIQKIYAKSSIADILFLLRTSINQANVDTILCCFLRNAISREFITTSQISQFFPNIGQQMEVQRTPSLRLTARFNFTTSEQFKHSCSDDMLNGQNGDLIFQNEIQTFADSQISIRGLQLMGDFNPY